MLPQMTPQQRRMRAEEKHQRLLAFLASGETWTDAGNAAQLWKLSIDAATTTLRAMVRHRMLVREDIPVGMRATYPIYGISPDGIAACLVAAPNSPEHQQGRITGMNLAHHLAVQQVRIIAERAGWTLWTPGRHLYKTGLTVVPDALGTDTEGQRVAIEMERNVKSLKRRREVISAHVLAIAQSKKWDRVLYVCDARCNAERLQELYMSIDYLDTPAGRTAMTDAHRSRFEFVNLSDFKG